MNKPNGERCRGWDCQPLPAGACACADSRAAVPAETVCTSAYFLAEEGLNSIARMSLAPKEPNKSTV